MKIVMFTDAYWPRVNGIAVAIETCSQALIRAGHEVAIVCSAYPDSMDIRRITAAAGEQPEGPQIIRVPSMPLAISSEDRIAMFHKVFWVSKRVESFNPDIIHIHSEFVIAEFGFHYAKSHRLPVIYTFHTLWEEYIENYLPILPGPVLRFFARRIIKYILKRADSIIVPSVQAGEMVRKYRINKETHLLPTGIEPVFFDRDVGEIVYFRGVMEQMYPALRDKRILIFAGRIAKEKNVAFLLKILPAIVARHPEVVLLIAGNGPELPELRNESGRLGLADHIVFTGYLERKDLALAYGMSDIFVFPSLTETQGLVTIEAMYSGIPVVAIGSMGTIMVMGGGGGGFMVQNDPEEFTARVFDLLEDSDLYFRKAGEARSHAVEWTIDAMVEKLVGVYEETLRRFPRHC